MNIQYASDLHLEFPQNKNFLKLNPLQPVGDILVLAGDIVPFKQMGKHGDFFRYISDHFKITYWVPGNHEYYYFDAATKCGIINEKIKKNIHMVNNIAIQHDGIKFLFSTMWAKISSAYEWQIEKNMSDFIVIKYNGFRFSSRQFNQFHTESLSFLKQELSQSNSGKTMVVTHHVPTQMHYPTEYRGSVLNDAFAVELFDLIEAEGPDYWIYGHHHYNQPVFEIGKTKMLTNQLGYVHNGELKNFSTVANVVI